MRFQNRDGEILVAIYERDGVLAKRHIKEMFWPHATLRAMEQRLAKLKKYGYITWPTPQQRVTKPIPEPIVWLNWNGILYIAGQQGISVTEPKNDSENQIRILEKKLRGLGVRWQREPRWSQLEHDLAVVDFRLAVEKAVSQLPLTLETWLPEGVFLADTDVIRYVHRGEKGRRGVRPDGYFTIVDERRANHQKKRQRLLLELDNATHSNTKFGKNKAVAGLKYINSEEYKARFGFNNGRWLVVTTGKVRMDNLRQQTYKEIGNSNQFLFTTFEHIEKAQNVLTDPIWFIAKEKGEAVEPVALFNLFPADLI